MKHLLPENFVPNEAEFSWPLYAITVAIALLGMYIENRKIIDDWIHCNMHIPKFTYKKKKKSIL